MSRSLKYATLCSGVECMSAACGGLPLEPVFFSEIEPFPCAVLKHRFPEIPNLGDMSRIRRTEDDRITNGVVSVPVPDGGIDIIAAGCPCQDFSIAGKRAGGEEGSGTRSSLVFELVRIVREIQPRYFIYENVPGMLTSNEGRDFANIIMAFRDCGYALAWRTLDAQYVRVDGLERAVPQRRRRVWVVGCAGEDLQRASEILFEPQGVCGDRPPRRVTGQGTAKASRGRARLPDGVVGRTSGFDPYEPGDVKSLNHGLAGTLINGSCPGCHSGVVEVYENHAQDCRVKPCGEVAPTIGVSNANGVGTGGNNPLVVDTFVKVSHARVTDPHAVCLGFKSNPSEKTRGIGAEREVSPTVTAQFDGAVCFGINANGVTMTAQIPFRKECAETLAVRHQGGVLVPNVAAMRYIVRRLTPTECERLMGLPDGWTLPAFAPSEITDALVGEFRRIHDTFGAVMAAYAGRPAPRPKTAAWVRRWLERIADPATCPDAPRYKACGNGWATNQPRWIILRILFFEGIDPWGPEETTEPIETKGIAT